MSDLSVAQAVLCLEHQAQRHIDHAAIEGECCSLGAEWHRAEARRMLAQVEALRQSERDILGAG